MKPLCFLDLDDTILLHRKPVHNTVAFFLWLKEHFEIRWLTRWCPDGHMPIQNVAYLSALLGVEVGCLDNPKSFWRSKAEAIDWDTDREWVWVENDLFSQFPEDGYGLQTENGKQPLDRRSANRNSNRRNYYQTDLSLWTGSGWIDALDANEPNNAIARTWKALEKRFQYAQLYSFPAKCANCGSVVGPTEIPRKTLDKPESIS